MRVFTKNIPNWVGTIVTSYQTKTVIVLSVPLMQRTLQLQSGIKTSHCSLYYFCGWTLNGIFWGDLDFRSMQMIGSLTKVSEFQTTANSVSNYSYINMINVIFGAWCQNKYVKDVQQWLNIIWLSYLIKLHPDYKVI